MHFDSCGHTLGVFVVSNSENLIRFRELSLNNFQHFIHSGMNCKLPSSLLFFSSSHTGTDFNKAAGIVVR